MREVSGQPRGKRAHCITYIALDNVCNNIPSVSLPFWSKVKFTSETYNQWRGRGRDRTIQRHYYPVEPRHVGITVESCFRNTSFLFCLMLLSSSLALYFVRSALLVRCTASCFACGQIQETCICR